MATTANTISTSSTLEEFRIQFNTLVNDITALDAGNIFSTAIIFEGATNDANETTLTVVDPTADRTITLPNVTGTVVTTANSDSATTTTSSSDADFVLVDDAGTLKKITPTNLGIGISAFDDITAGDAAVNITTSSGNITIDAAANDSDIILKGTDGGVDTTFLTIDGSAAGKATFNGEIVSGGVVTANAGVVVDNITIDGTEIDLSSGDLTLDVAGDIILDADGADVIFKDAGTAIGTFTNSSTDFVIASNVSNKDMLFKGNDGGSTITALTLDMSDAGTATFNNDVVVGNDLELTSDSSVIVFGTNSDVTLTHVHDTGLTLTHVGTGNNTPVVLQLKSEEDAIIADEVIASLEFAAGDSDGTDGATVAAGIHAIAEDTFSASVNKTKLVFTTGVSETAASSATAKMTLSSAGLLTIADDFVIKDGGTIGVASDADAITIASDGQITLSQDLTLSGEIIVNSDATLKENILPITNPLDIINSIKGVQYNFKDKEKKNIKYGFLAQEMEKVLPSIVHETDPQKNLLGIAYDNIIAILLEGIKSLSNEVEELKNKIEK